MSTYVISAVILSIIISAIHTAHVQQKALMAAENAYRESLEALGADGQNNQLRQDALERGREFAELARKKAGSKGVAMFDEVALTNDITARLGSKPSDRSTVTCPDCAEQIQAAARICRFCGAQAQGHRAAA